MRALSSSSYVVRLTFGCLALLVSLALIAPGRQQSDKPDSNSHHKNTARFEPDSGGAAQTATSVEQLQQVCAEIDNSYDCAQAIERHQLKQPQYARNVARGGNRLNMKLSNGASLTLEDSKESDDASVTKYSFRDHLSEIGYYLVHCQYYEGNDYLMVSERTGKRSKLQGTPVVSPDRQRIATASSGLFGGYGPNAVQMWRLTPRGLVLEQTIEPEGWEPSDVKWIDNRTIRLTKSLMPDQNGNRIAEPVLLKLNKKWIIVEQ